MGSSEFAVASMTALLRSKHEILAVVAQPDKPADRGQQVKSCPAAEFAKENNLFLFQPAKVKNNAEFIERVRSLNCDAIVVVAYGKILPKELLDIPPKGCINVHSSLLPKYRGAAPINWPVINGDSTTGVTTMFMNEKMDEGDILLQAQCEIMPHETAGELHDHLALIGGDLLVKTLDQIEEGSLKGIPQNHAEATYTVKLTKEMGCIDWSKSAEQIYNLIRGLQPWPKAFTKLPSGDVLTIFDAAPFDAPSSEKAGTIVSVDKGITVATGDGLLCLLEVQLAGKKRMSAVDFLKGHKLLAGERLG